MCVLPLIERSSADPVWFNLRQRRDIVLWWTFNCRTTWVWYCPDQWRPMTFRAAGSNLSIAVFHSSNDNSLFHTQGLYCMNRFFCVMTATLIVHVFKNTLDELPDCSYRHFVFSIHIYSLLKYLIINIHLFIVNLISKMNRIYAFLYSLQTTCILMVNMMV